MPTQDLSHLLPWLTDRPPGYDRVLDAFEAAVVEHGIQRASFARIAAAGGFHRSLVQHHFKTREGLLRAALDRVAERYHARLELIRSEAPPGARLDAILSWMFAPLGDGGPPRIARVVDAAVAVAGSVPEARTALARLYERFVVEIVAELEILRPKADGVAVSDAATQIVALSYGRAGLDTLALRARSPGASRGLCDLLIRGL